MDRRIRIHADFAADFRRQVGWLVGAGRADWLAGLYDGVEQLALRLRHFPEMGTVTQVDDAVVLRQVVLRRIPMIVWYGYRRHEPIGDVWLLRLFGSGQDRPNRRPSAW